MPELGDVEGFRRVASRFHGAVIERVDVLDAGSLRDVDPQHFTEAVCGGRIGPATRVGKWLLLPVAPVTVLFHFGMTGSLVALNDMERLEFHDRVVFVTDGGRLAFRDPRKLRGVYVADGDAQVREVMGVIGPDALDVSPQVLRDRLSPVRSSIKASLIDQKRIAGIGNFGADEILWRAHIRPHIAPSSLPDRQWQQLHRSLREVLSATARAGHTPRGPRWLTGARFREDFRCPICDASLERGTVAARSTVWCPICQPSANL